MPHLPFHPAPGLSDLAPGWFVLPQNPLTMGPSTVLVPTMAATAPGRWTRTPTLADLVQASFPVPQNPVVQNLVMGLQGLRGMRGCCGLGCGGGGCGQPYGLNGLGQTPGTDALSTWLAANGGSPSRSKILAGCSAADSASCLRSCSTGWMRRMPLLPRPQAIPTWAG